ncbi:MAG TPA: DNA internalization-related competence protein ComEC/Rec2 [Thermoanaerobaculia bacterium]|nr:DNA internalization-related competence protein ComEC/Rec2 [Thermoanaerobaculia bacterium]
MRAPLALDAAACAAGIALGGVAAAPPVPLLVCLGGLGVALGGRRGRLLAWIAVGLLMVTLRGPVSPGAAGIDARLPVAVEGAVAGCWSAPRGQARAWLQVDTLVQRGRPRVGRWDVRLQLPDAAAMPFCGGRLRARGYLKPPRRYHNLPPSQVGEWSLYVKSPLLAEVTAPPGALAVAVSWVRRRVLSSAAGDETGDPWLALEGSVAGAGEPPAPVEARPGERLALALLLGEATALPPEWREGMRRAGLSHLLAVSGLHVGMLAALVALVLLPAPRGWRIAGAALAALAYALLVGPRPSVLRAAAMAAAAAAALGLRRPPQALNALGLAALALLLTDPARLGHLGFQLSFAATTGILLLAPRLARALSWLPRPLALSLAVTLAAQLATLPWSLAAFHRVAPLAPLANLLAVPWAGVVLAAAAGWAATRVLAPPLASWMLPVLDGLAAPVAWLAEIPANPWWSLPVAAPWPAALLATGLMAWSVVAPVRWWSLSARMLLAFALAAGWRHPGSRGVEVVVVDVGQGDAVLLRDGREAVLVDGGGWGRAGFGGRVVLPVLAALGQRRLAALVVTHPDADHCGGIADLAREVPAAALWTAEGWGESSCARRLSGLPLPHRELAPGDELAVGRWRLRVLGPLPESGPDANARSLVLLAAALGRRVLLTGDVDAAGERLLERHWGGAALAADLLKVAHHGSRTSTSPSLLAAVRPRLAVISAGRRNPYGHPSAVVLATLDRHRVRVLRTDVHGMVRVAWEGPERWRIAVTAP